MKKKKKKRRPAHELALQVVIADSHDPHMPMAFKKKKKKERLGYFDHSVALVTNSTCAWEDTTAAAILAAGQTAR